MKTTSKPAAIGLAGFLLIAMAAMLVIQHQALHRVLEESRLLQERVNSLTARADQLTEEKERLSKLIAPVQAEAGAPPRQAPSREMLRLRGEVGRLSLQEREAEQSLRDQMQAAQSKVANAEAEFGRLTKLHSEKLVSVGELEQARFALELLKAQAKGDGAEAARIRLQQAEEDLGRAAALRSQNLISQTEYDEAVSKVESVKARTDR